MTTQDKNKLGNISERSKRILGSFFAHIVLHPLKLLVYGVYKVLYVLIWSRFWGKMASKGSKGSSSRHPNDNTDGCLPPVIIADIRRHHKQAYAYIDKALRIDESAGTYLISQN
jgi:hypothetical protein